MSLNKFREYTAVWTTITCNVHQDGITETLIGVSVTSMGKRSREVRVGAVKDVILPSPAYEKQAEEQCGGPERSESTEEQKMLVQWQGVLTEYGNLEPICGLWWDHVWDGGVERGGRETQAVTIDCPPQDLA